MIILYKRIQFGGFFLVASAASFIDEGSTNFYILDIKMLFALSKVRNPIKLRNLLVRNRHIAVKLTCRLFSNFDLKI